MLGPVVQMLLQTPAYQSARIQVLAVFPISTSDASLMVQVIEYPYPLHGKLN